MFSDPSEAYYLALLAEFVLNEVDHDIPSTWTFAPLWNAQRHQFLMVNSYPNSARNDAYETRQNLLECVRNLAKLLKDARRTLSLEYRVPYEADQRSGL
jgi:hypothetical protein